MMIPWPKNIPKSKRFKFQRFSFISETANSSRNQEIQAQMTYRALELLALPPDSSSYILDIGCGSGLSGEILEEEGHVWAGVDISPSMLGKDDSYCQLTLNPRIFFTEVALERDVEGDLFLQDIGQGLGFRPGTFDGAIRHVNAPSFCSIIDTPHTPFQYIGLTMAIQRRNITSYIIASPSFDSFLHHSVFGIKKPS